MIIERFNIGLLWSILIGLSTLLLHLRCSHVKNPCLRWRTNILQYLWRSPYRSHGAHCSVKSCTNMFFFFLLRMCARITNWIMWNQPLCIGHLWRKALNALSYTPPDGDLLFLFPSNFVRYEKFYEISLVLANFIENDSTKQCGMNTLCIRNYLPFIWIDGKKKICLYLSRR